MLKFLASMSILWVALATLPTQAQADPYDESQSNFLRYVAYFLHPFGVAAEWTVMRPIHTMMSGHKSLEFFPGTIPIPPSSNLRSPSTSASQKTIPWWGYLTGE
tara:strand:- start:387 stop:698 length:312 start_codon:yes stop_codon:yes gene_type:complete